MPGSYTERLKEAEALVARARTPAERKAFEEIAEVWRRLAKIGEPGRKPEGPSGAESGS